MRVFLSHSSSDKKKYVNYIAEKLNSDEVIIDTKSFIPSRKNDAEMDRLISDCDIFTYFISKESLASENVKKELDLFEKYKKTTDKEFIPIIIEGDIAYDDGRMREWFRDYNLRRVTKPSKAFAIIDEAIRIKTWRYYHLLKEREQLFVGRNDFINRFEQRYYDRKIGKAIVYVASGFDKIGRTAFLTHCLKKVNRCREAYSFPKFHLSSLDGIESFIYNINESGVSPFVDLEYLGNKSMEEKIKIAQQQLEGFSNNDDIIHIVDSGCIIRSNGKVSEWFESIIKGVDNIKIGARLIISSRYSCQNAYEQKLWSISLTELTEQERSWLFSKYLQISSISLSNDEFDTCLNWLQGYPEQVFFLVNSIEKIGYEATRSDSKNIVDYSLQRAGSILSRYMDDSDSMAFIATIAETGIIKVDTLLKAFGDNEKYRILFTDMLLLSVCTNEGVSKEYVRLSDSIKDYIDRKKIKKPEEVISKIKSIILDDMNSDAHGLPDSSDLYFAMKVDIEENGTLDNKYLFPSHLARCMRDLYNKREDDKQVIKIAEYLINKERTIDRYTLNTARYYLCLALARKRDPRVLIEVSLLNNAERYFISGFYYRLIGEWAQAIGQLENALKEYPEHKRAKRELMTAYIRLDEYDKAFVLAEECYCTDSSNIYFAHGYFKCLLSKYAKAHDKKYKEKMEKILEIKISDDFRDKSMLAAMQALYTYHINASKDEAYNILNRQVVTHKNDIYALIEKFNIAEKAFDIPMMQVTSGSIREFAKDKDSFEDIIVINDVLLLAHNGDFDQAVKVIYNLPHIYSSSFREKQLEKIEKIRVSSVL